MYNYTRTFKSAPDMEAFAQEAKKAGHRLELDKVNMAVTVKGLKENEWRAYREADTNA